MKNTNLKALSLALIACTATISGCATLKGKLKKGDEVIETATQSDSAYYQEAQTAIAKERYNDAATALNNIRTFYPTGRYAEQALLDLIFVHYQSGDYEAVTVNTAQFLQSYPNSRYADYALYAQGVTNMQGSPKAGRLIPLKQSERDTSYLRLAFADFSELINRYPNSPYAGDAALRMIDIYNQFAHHELTAAYWYVKREAYIAAANRAKWVFQYYPQSTSVPEAIAILAYSHDKLGLASTSNQYKTLLQINYPNYLTSNRQVRLPKASTSPWQRTINAISFGKLGKAQTISNASGNYSGATVPQTIISAKQLTLANGYSEQPNN